MKSSVKTTTAPRFSVVLPCFNEVDNVVPLLEELKAAFEGIEGGFEVIYVDDCSTDGTTEGLRELAQSDPVVRHVLHARNFGQSAGMLTGFRAARGRIIVTMDADLQNDPADIPAMLQMMEDEGADCVCGIRAKRRDSFSKRLSSRIANAVRGRLLGDGIHDAGCSFRMIRRQATRQLVAFKGMHRFLPTMLKMQGYHVVEIPINHRPRTAGYSKYGVGNRAWVGVLDVIGMMWYRKRFIPPRRVSRQR